MQTLYPELSLTLIQAFFLELLLTLLRNSHRVKFLCSLHRDQSISKSGLMGDAEPVPLHEYIISITHTTISLFILQFFE